jgi:hypothetical protein
MATDYAIMLDDHPGTVADLAEALGCAGINLLGFCGMAVDGIGRAHIAVDDREGTHRALEDAGIRVGESQQVVLVDIEDAPGTLGALTRKIADAGLNLTVAYLGTADRMIVGADDIDRLKDVLGS